MQTAQGLQMIVIQGQPGSQQAVPLMSQPQGYNPQIGSKSPCEVSKQDLKLIRYSRTCE